MAAPEPPEVVCSRLSKRFAGGVQALAPCDLSFAAGRTTALVGPSGCGKSTLLRLIAGLETPTSGSVRIGGQPPERVRIAAGLAVAFQDSALLPWRSVRGNIALALKLARQPRDPQLVDHLIRLVGLDGFADARPAALSGGMRQRAAIARVMATRPGLLLLDEPFGAVDELTRRQLAEDLPGLWQQRGTTAVLVTHSVAEAVLLADRVLVLSPRPARVAADIPIDLPHPRDPALPDAPEFHALTRRVSSALAQAVRADGRLAAE